MNTREISLKIIEKILRGYSLEKATQELNIFNNLDKRNKSFIRMLVLTFLRRNGEVDLVIDRYVKKPLRKKDEKLKNILRIGITQILYLEVSDHASTFTSVEITKKYYRGFESFVNAILRNVCRERSKILHTLNPLNNLPEWIKGGLYEHIKAKDIDAIAKTVVEIPSLDIHFRSKEIINEIWVKKLKGKVILKNIVRFKNVGEIENIPKFNQGEWWIQSVAASIPCLIIENLLIKNRTKKRIIEVGSAPGGKTLQLCNAGFKVTAVEKSSRRVLNLKENLKRMNFKPEIVCNDILFLDMPKFFDCALIDAPCSASGIIQKKPEILVQKKNLESLIIQQERILQKTSTLIKKNGIIVYAVCSLIFKEGRGQINNFLKKNRNYKKIDLSRIGSNFDCHINNGDIIVSPLNYKRFGGADGFFISCLRYIGE